MQEATCFNCGGVGHYRDDCPKPSKPEVCDICGSPGHAKECKACRLCKQEGHISRDCLDRDEWKANQRTSFKVPSKFDCKLRMAQRLMSGEPVEPFVESTVKDGGEGSLGTETQGTDAATVTRRSSMPLRPELALATDRVGSRAEMTVGAGSWVEMAARSCQL